MGEGEWLHGIAVWLNGYYGHKRTDGSRCFPQWEEHWLPSVYRVSYLRPRRRDAMYILPRMLLFYTPGYVDEAAYGLESSAKVNIIWRKGQASMPNKFGEFIRHYPYCLEYLILATLRCYPTIYLVPTPNFHRF